MILEDIRQIENVVENYVSAMIKGEDVSPYASEKIIKETEAVTESLKALKYNSIYELITALMGQLGDKLDGISFEDMVKPKRIYIQEIFNSLNACTVLVETPSIEALVQGIHITKFDQYILINENDQWVFDSTVKSS